MVKRTRRKNKKREKEHSAYFVVKAETTKPKLVEGPSLCGRVSLSLFNREGEGEVNSILCEVTKEIREVQRKPQRQRTRQTRRKKRKKNTEPLLPTTPALIVHAHAHARNRKHKHKHKYKYKYEYRPTKRKEEQGETPTTEGRKSGNETKNKRKRVCSSVELGAALA